MDLAEFLVARIGDEQADAMAGWRWKALPAGEYARLQARVLAECDAKRRLVEELARMLRDESGWDDVEYKVMSYLALPHADHPDYQPEWAVDQAKV